MKLPFEVGDATKRLNPDLFKAGPKGKTVLREPQTKTGSKLEDRFYGEILTPMFCEGVTIQRQFRVRVTDDDAVVLVHYTADFAIWTPVGHGWTCELIEVKDPRRKPHSDELVRPKMAKMRNPWIKSVTLWTWDGNEWKERLLA